MFTDKVDLKAFEKQDPEYQDLLRRVLSIQADCEIGGPNLYVKEILPNAPTNLDQLIAPQRQYRRYRRQALCRSQRGKLPSRQWHPTTQVDMRRISDGVKTQGRYKTTEQVERAHVEDHEFSYLYQNADGFHFMNNDNYDQVQVSKEIVGSSAPYLQENMTVKLSMHEGNPVAIQLPQRVTLEVVETESVTKGQTASSSYKPAMLSNGIRTGVSPHVSTGTRIVVNTFVMDEWGPDERQEGTGTECQSWCEVLLWVVPAKVFGTWQMGDGATLTIPTRPP